MMIVLSYVGHGALLGWGSEGAAVQGMWLLRSLVVQTKVSSHQIGELVLHFCIALGGRESAL